VTGCGKPSSTACRAWWAKRVEGGAYGRAQPLRFGAKSRRIDRIADDGVTDMGHMHPDVMRAT
jgi:hypothetical protein